jgi:predicted SAM-dependent methyltransferase
MTAIKSGTDEARGCIPFGIMQHIMEGTGVDLGYGGDAITRDAITVDLPRPYTRVGTDPHHVKGDARVLPFRDDVLDYVYSSHLLEDFPNTAEVLAEWVRVLRVGGLLVLVLPNELEYREYCRDRGEGRNEHHSIEEMSIEYMRPIVEDCGCRVMAAAPVGKYSFMIIADKHAR